MAGNSVTDPRENSTTAKKTTVQVIVQICLQEFQFYAIALLTLLIPNLGLMYTKK